MAKLNSLSLRILLVSLIASCAFASMVWYGFQLLQQEQITAATSAAKFQALTKLVAVAGALESDVKETVKYSDFLSLIVSHKPDITQQEIDGYAELVLEQNDSIVGIQFAPEGVVQMVYPYEQHHMAIGHDLLNDPNRRQSALQAIETGKAVLQGPVQAVQGGYFLFNRKAIFVPSEEGQKFWGFSIVAVDFDRLIDQYQQSMHDDQYLFSLSVRDDNNQPLLLWGDTQPPNATTIHQSIELPHATWDLNIFPKTDWNAKNTTIFRAIQFHLLMTALVFFLTFASTASYLVYRQKSRLDPLTGSLNRNSIHRYAETLLSRHTPFTLFVMDLNGFKTINDTYGHYVGDQVLIEVTKRLQTTLGKTARLSRFGGDEYVAISTHPQHDTESLINQIMMTVMRPMQIEGHTLIIELAVGWAHFTGQTNRYSVLYQEADQRMYAAKQPRSVQTAKP